MNPKILIPVIIIIALYLIICFVDLFKVNKTKFLPKWAWGLIICISVPLGGIIYYLLGRDVLGESDE
ncbi:PLDc N-terminal domain-containing protein [Staphylococcus equorum]|uniref:PLDc N-terminal domain-containing protein n=1 Tax=Staphylococcus equorum TaxID=246432 RepID=A0A9X4LHQ5_9STAP|nr:PLDc N-terminal domain-containing protein [Staphylococcus equorum]MDG0843982.1 PLDc N-terminal domain-containing protein [Staphylococcus equorum]MDG0860273.1 PLDc N-terminal domain-containing protein [Staphylococcus equorum]